MHRRHDLAFGHLLGSGIRLLDALAAHLIGIPSVIAHELEAFVRDVLGYAGDEVVVAKHFKIELDLGVHPRAVNDRVPGAIGAAFYRPRADYLKPSFKRYTIFLLIYI